MKKRIMSFDQRYCHDVIRNILSLQMLTCFDWLATQVC